MIIEFLKGHNKTISVAESCTGGVVAKMITDEVGASEVFHMSVVTYSNEAKMKLLGVSEEVIASHGAVSPETARAMAEGVKLLGLTNIGVGITGIAGPGGGSVEKPVGLVYIAIADDEKVVCHKNIFQGTRQEVREQAALAALRYVQEV